GIEEIRRLVVAGHGPDGLAEEVEPRRVEAAAQREVGLEAVGVAQPRLVLDGEREQDLPGLASDEVHHTAHGRRSAGPSWCDVPRTLGCVACRRSLAKATVAVVRS